MITQAEYAKSYKEVWEILKFVPKKYFEKVPSNLVRFLKKIWIRNMNIKLILV